MGILGALLSLPLAPLRGTLAAAEQIRLQAEEEFYSPATIRAHLEDVERQHAEGLLSEDEAAALEDELIDRLMVGGSRPRED
jgi:hypothetical protein